MYEAKVSSGNTSAILEGFTPFELILLLSLLYMRFDLILKRKPLISKD